MRDSYTNPSETKRIKSFEIFGLTNRIHDTNLSKTGLRNESTIRIFQKQVYETNPRYKSLRFGFANPDSRVRQPGFVNHDTKRIFLESGFVTTIQNKSMDSRNKSMFLRISYTIPASLELLRLCSLCYIMVMH
jgi:hypothetical protein